MTGFLDSWRNWLDPRDKREPSDRVWRRESKSEVERDLKYYKKLYPQWKFKVRKSKEIPDSYLGVAFDIFYKNK